MSTTGAAGTPATPVPPGPAAASRPWVAGLAVFAGVIMIAVGVVAALNGIAALVGDPIYVTVAGYLYAMDLTTWGWIHLILGVLVAVAGGAVIAGQPWARVTGIMLAGLHLIANFLFLPYAPWWSLLIIALDVAVIWALSVYRPDEAFR